MLQRLLLPLALIVSFYSSVTEAEPRLRTSRALRRDDIQVELMFTERAFFAAEGENEIKDLELKVIKGGRSAFSAKVFEDLTNVNLVDGPELFHRPGRTVPDILLAANGNRSINFIFNETTGQYEAGSESEEPTSSDFHVVKRFKARDMDIVLEFDRREGAAESPHLIIKRKDGGISLHRVQPDDDSPAQTFRGPVAYDLDGDGSEEIYLEAVTNGGTCCGFSKIFYFVKYKNAFLEIEKDWGNFRALPERKDINSDNVIEFISRNDRFALEFGSFSETHLAPLQIWQFNKGVFQDRTREYPDILKEHASAMLAHFHDGNSHFHHSEVALAAYVADQCQAGSCESALRDASTFPVRRAPTDGQETVDESPFIDRLRRHLIRYNYMEQAAQSSGRAASR